jgi:hypothetical protein
MVGWGDSGGIRGRWAAGAGRRARRRLGGAAGRRRSLWPVPGATSPPDPPHPPPTPRGISVMEDEGVMADHLSGVSATDGQWHHVAVTWESSTGKATLYQDGRPVWFVTRGKGKTIPRCVCRREGGALGAGRLPAWGRPAPRRRSLCAAANAPALATCAAASPRALAPVSPPQRRHPGHRPRAGLPGRLLRLGRRRHRQRVGGARPRRGAGPRGGRAGPSSAPRAAPAEAPLFASRPLITIDPPIPTLTRPLPVAPPPSTPPPPSWVRWNTARRTSSASSRRCACGRWGGAVGGGSRARGGGVVPAAAPTRGRPRPTRRWTRTCPHTRTLRSTHRPPPPKVVRTPEQIRAGMASDEGAGGVDRDDPNLVAYWKFDEGTGYTVKVRGWELWGA